MAARPCEAVLVVGVLTGYCGVVNPGR